MQSLAQMMTLKKYLDEKRQNVANYITECYAVHYICIFEVFFMKHIFIVNPAAGKKSHATSFIPEIKDYCDSHNISYSICLTERPGHATEIAKKESESGERVRLYALGGDGTLLEVANGAKGYENVEITVIPCGSGNDYVKSYGDINEFLKIPDLIEGSPKKVDAIRCMDYLSLNICSMGMDADICARMSNYKKWPLVSGPLAYDLACIDTMIRPIGNQLDVTMETENDIEKRSGNYMFAIAANGQYYGGGYRGAPGSITDDGLLDFVLIHNISKMQALKKIGGYKKGEHYSWEICEHLRGTKMTVSCPKEINVNIDGEIIHSKSVTFEILPKYFNFVLPKTLI